ncbi:MAG: hypothetical protein NXI32_23860 [bacterium]|nr:hypothetical protein [bacterium]
MRIQLVLTFTSPDRPGIVDELTAVVVRHGGNWEESRLARLSGDFAGIARVTVDESQLDALRRDLLALEKKELTVQLKQTEARQPQRDYLMATLECSGADHEGIVNGVARHLAQSGINVQEMSTSLAPAPITGTPLFHMHCQVQIPVDCDRDALHADLRRLESELAVEIVLDDSSEQAARAPQGG